ncbi:MAG TPA: hypothetical protein VFJ16_25235 [Longimicrobium sp.]|nr:hypothetical protein [Longimicrobium sp.]
MIKIRLDLDSLTVVSFPTHAREEARGTVNAHAGTQQPAHTCAYTCGSDIHFICCTG